MGDKFIVFRKRRDESLISIHVFLVDGSKKRKGAKNTNHGGVNKATKGYCHAKRGKYDKKRCRKTTAPTMTMVPTKTQTDSPTQPPTDPTTESPTDQPTESPTDSPTESPTDSPTESPTDQPTESPTDQPTESPTDSPTESPTDSLTESPTDLPTESPTDQPTESPTDPPTESPTDQPTESPTVSPTTAAACFSPIKPLIRDNVIGSIASPPRTDFSISFVIIPHSIPPPQKKYFSLLRFTDTQGDHAEYGDRSPMLFIIPGSLIIAFAQGSTKDGNLNFDSNIQLNMNQRNTVKIDYKGNQVTLYMDGINAGSMSIPINDRPQLNEWVIYASDKYYEPADADIEELCVKLF